RPAPRPPRPAARASPRHDRANAAAAGRLDHESRPTTSPSGEFPRPLVPSAARLRRFRRPVRPVRRGQPGNAGNAGRAGTTMSQASPPPGSSGPPGPSGDARAEVLGRVRAALADRPVPPPITRDYRTAGAGSPSLAADAPPGALLELLAGRL